MFPRPPGGAAAFVGRFSLSANAQDLEISGLAGESHKEYFLRGRLIGPTGSQNIIELRPNGLTTNLIGARSNEWAGAVDLTTWQIVDYSASFTGSPLVVTFNIHVHAAKSLNGVAVDRSYTGRVSIINTLAGVEAFHVDVLGKWTEQTTELTSLTIHSSLATGLSAGSEVLVFRPTVTFG